MAPNVKKKRLDPEVSDPTVQDARRRFLFTPCKTKADLKKWIYVYLGIDYPDGQVDPESNSDPMSLIWEIYETGLEGRIEWGRILAYAARDSFKCVEKGTKLLVRSGGLVPIEDILVGDIVWTGKSWQPVTNWIHDGVKDAVEMQLEDGRSLTVSPIHRVWSWSPGKMPNWKKVSELDISSDLVMVDATPQSAIDITHDSYKTGYVLGILAGDGCTTVMDSYGKVCVSASDRFVKEAWDEFCLETCGRIPKTPRTERPYDYWINSVEVVEKLHALGVSALYAHEKRIPTGALVNKHSMAGFISGLLDTDGSVSKRNNIVIELTSLELLKDCLSALNALGVNAYVRSNKKLYAKQNHIVHSLVIKAREFPKLESAGIKIKAQKANVVRDRLPNTKDTHDSIPYAFVKPLLDKLPKLGGRWKTGALKPKISRKYPTVAREKLTKLLEWAKFHNYLDPETLAEWEYVVSKKWVKPTGIINRVADLYDLTVENDHSYWSNGIVSHNTLGAAIIEILALFHMGRTVAHMAAIESQAKKSQQYVKKFLRRPYLRDFVTQENEREIHLGRYYDHTTKLSFTQDEMEILPVVVRNRLEHLTTFIAIVIATKAGANGQHASLFVCDEIEVVADPEAYEEAKFIPSLDSEGRDPITLLTSTRKWSIGLVQKEIDEAAESKLEIRHWNIIDVTEKSVDQDTMLYPCDQPSKPIKDFKVGDLIWGVNELGQPIQTQVTGLYDHGTIEGIQVTFEDGYQIVCSLDHKFLTEQGQLPLKEILERNLGVLCEQSCAAPEWRLDKSLPTGLTNSSRTRSSPKELSEVSRASWANRSPNRLDKPLWSNLFGQTKDAYSSSGLPRLQSLGIELPFGTNKIKDTKESTTTQRNNAKGQRWGRSLARNAPNGTRSFKNKWDKSSEGVANAKSTSVCGHTAKANGSKSEVDFGASRRSSCQSQENAYSSQKPLKTGINPSKIFSLVGRSNQMRGPTEASGLCITGSQNMDRSGRVLPLLCAQERPTGYRSTARKSTVQGLNAQPRSDVEAGRNLNTVGDGYLPQTEWTVARVAELAYAHAPLTQTGGLVLRKIVQAIPVGLRKMYDLGVAHAKHNFILPNGTVTSNCTPSRHLPTRPKLPIYVSEKKVKAVSEAEYGLLNEVQKEEYAVHEGFEGCLTNCKIFAACKGRLVNQECTSPLLKSISHVTKLFAASSAEKANAQLRCRKPSKEGLIYPNLDPEVHKKSAAEIMKMITGEDAPENLNKQQLIEKAKEIGVKFVTGMDHGFAHNFAVCTGFIDGNRLFMIDAFSIPELEIGQKIDICTERIKDLEPTIYPDPADPGARKTFQKYGFKCKEFNKARNSVKDGIDCVRSKILPALGGQPQIFFLKDDDGVAQLYSEVSKYHWMLSPDGKLSDVPDDEDDDLCDALRYLVLNEFPPRKTYTRSGPIPEHQAKAKPVADLGEQPVNEMTAQNFITKVLEQQGIALNEPDVSDQIKSAGNVRWII